MAKENHSWLHQFAPNNFSEKQLILPDEERNQFQEIIEGRATENLLLAGTAGCGKSSIAQLLVKHAVTPTIIQCPQYKADKHWQTGGYGWQMMVGSGNALHQFYYSKAELTKRKIDRVVVLEEFDELSNQSVFKTLLDDASASGAICVLTTNNLHEIDTTIRSRCSLFNFGHSSELWMMGENDKPAGCREQITRDLQLLMLRVLRTSLNKKSKDSGVLDSADTILFFKNLIQQYYPSVRECLLAVRKFIRKGELKVPPRLLKPLEEQ